MRNKLFRLLLMLVAVVGISLLLQPAEAHAEEKYCYICEDMVEFCNYCGDYCMVCYTGCDNCLSCEDCLKLCEECEDVCVVCNIGCDNCWVCEDCIKLCQNCDECLGCNGDGCSDTCEQLCEDCCSENDARCNICLRCTLCSSIKCEECGFCIECAPECQACGECMECHGGDGCANTCGQLCYECVSDNEGACPECEQCFLCVNWACDSCYKCEECLTGEFACSICEECIECNAPGSCGSCNACWNCVPICVSCENACTECSTLCSDCEEYCGDCARICESCGVCENCAVLCEDCDLCENCVQLCGECGVCEECVDLCDSCGELCVECAFAWCEDCNTCVDCVDICEECEAICVDCADGWCEECYTCGDCENICTVCEQMCKTCAFAWCLDCDACEECVDICENCEKICSDCADGWCDDCHCCTGCVDLCDTCGYCMRCCTCEGGNGGAEEDSHQHDTTKVPGFEPTCTVDGQRTYYTCGCGMWFEDAAATRQILSKKSVILPAGHNYGKLNPGSDPVHTAQELAPGMKPHYICEDCGNYFTAGKKQTDLNSLVIPAPAHKYGSSWGYKAADGHGKTCACGAVEAVLPHVPGPEATDTKPQLCQECDYIIKHAKNHIHKLSLVPGKEPTCTEKGQMEHYSCECGKLFADAQGEQEIAISGSIVLMPGHSLGRPIPEMPATHNPDGTVVAGMKAHYVCEGCNKTFNLNKQEKPAESLGITKAEHRFYDGNGDGKCDDCERILEQINQQEAEATQPTPPHTDADKAPAGSESSDSMPWWIIVLLALLTTGGGVLAAVLIMNKKGNKEASKGKEEEEK